ncbi:hypothetical protein [Amylibacter sp. IMCC11727]|uniref:hypothetical protein n=1 Tax=Amylibacter sp. IMCC11727 TaxID=3039851 RepID=UPI00244E039C|nr:hypothetical protein [Amylibacter sp. IMCC11727]WGI23471.1 hypothetical protein QBD29_08595 [Amylibacter sp. IMCC11727]
MKQTKLAIAAFAIGLSGTASMAETFICELHDARNSGWLPEKLVVQISSDETMGQTYDPITFSTLNGFAPTRVHAENSVRVELRWKTGRYRNSSEMRSRDRPSSVPTEIEYRATILRGGNKILMRAAPDGVRDRFSAKGSCEIVNASINEVVRR